MKEGANSMEDKSGNMYSYQDDQKSNIIKTDAIRRSLGNKNPNNIPVINNNINNNNNKEEEKTLQEYQEDDDTVTIHIDQSPPPYWMFFIVFALIQIIILILIGFYFDWDEYYTDTKSIYSYSNNTLNETITTTTTITGGDVYLAIENKYKLFQEINIIILLGFGFLRSFLKHYSWTSISLTIIAMVLSTEFGLFLLISWTAIFKEKWVDGKFNFQFLLDANFCAGTVVISLGPILGKISMPQYLILIIIETIGVTFNYTLLRQILKIIDIGGTLTVHLFGSIFSGVFSFVSSFGKNEKERIQQSKHFGSNYYSNIFALFGSLIIISYYPAFNTALLNDNLYKTINNNSRIVKPKYEGIINTYLAILGSIVGTFTMSPIFNKGKLLIQDVLNSCFIGGICIGGCCHLIDHYWVPILFGFFTALLTTLLTNILSNKLRNIGFHDSSNTIFYHGIPGFLGGIFTTIFVANMQTWIDNKQKNNVYKYIGTFLDYFSDYDNFGTSEVKFGAYAATHFAAIFITIALAFACGFLAGFSIKFCNCYLAMRYFNDSEFFDVNESDRFPWKDENVRLELEYNPRE